MDNNIMTGIGSKQLWGFSPAVDFYDCSPYSDSARTQVLQIGMADIRHILKSAAQMHRHGEQYGIDVYVMEQSMESVCRSMLLVLVLSDETYSEQNRIETFLEIYGNSHIRPKTIAYIKELCPYIMKYASDDDNDGVLSHMFDLSLLKFKDRDEIEGIAKRWKEEKSFKMSLLWDHRLRNYYQDRFDSKDNLIDWDYHLRGIKDYASIIHILHYRRWRNTGLAFEQRGCEYTEPNYTLGTYREATEKKKGKIQLLGYWGDIVISPYVALGVECDNDSYYEIRQKQHIKNAFHVAEYNVMCWLHEARTGERYVEEKEKKMNNKEEQNQPLVEINEVEEEDGNDENNIPKPNPQLLQGFKDIKIHIVSGENDVKRLYRKSKLHNKFDLVLLATTHMHQIDNEFNILLKNDCVVYIETIKYLLFKKEQKELYVSKMNELSIEMKWKRSKQKDNEKDEKLNYLKFNRTQ